MTQIEQIIDKDENEKEVFRKLIPPSDSHKGQNGKVMIIGGSELFHAASKWSLDVLTRLVDMVFYCSTSENNELVETKMKKEAKGEFWGGIVVERNEMIPYIEEAEVILIGPGMTRSEETKELTDKLLTAYPDKKWIIDAGALQMGAAKLFPRRAILTPHEKELAGLEIEELTDGIVLLVKGVVDKILVMEGGEMKEVAEISGGNAGMTKGGTGDCLAGLTAGIYAHNENMIEIAKAASKICKKAGEELWQEVGPFFSAGDLANRIPETLWEQVREIAN